MEARVADVLTSRLSAADLALANITRPALEELAPRLRSRRLISSGYLPTDTGGLEGFRHRRHLTRDGWAADLYEAAQ